MTIYCNLLVFMLWDFVLTLYIYIYIYIYRCILSMKDKLRANGFKIYKSHIIFTHSTLERDLKFPYDLVGPIWFHLKGLPLSHIFIALLSLW